MDIENEDLRLTDIDCPNCTTDLENEAYDVAGEHYGCPDCGFEAVTGPLDTAASRTTRAMIKADQLLWPNARLICTIFAAIAFAVSSYASPFGGWSTAAGVAALVLGFGGAFDPLRCCESCGLRIDEDDHWCSNCGHQIDEPVSYVDLDETPLHELVRSVAGSLLPSWLSIGPGTVTLTTTSLHGLVQRLLQLRLPWRTFFLLGAVAGILSYFIATIGGAFFLIETAENVLQASSGGTGGGSSGLPHLDGDDFLAGFYIITAIIVAVVIHELGHALAFEFHDVHIDKSGLSFLAFIPVVGWVEPEYHDDLSPLKKIEGSAAGIAANYLTAAILMPILALGTTTLPADGLSIPEAAVQLHPLTNIAFYLYAMSIFLALPNAIPALGMDGQDIQSAILEAVNDRFDIHADLDTNAAIATNLVFVGGLLAIAVTAVML